MRNLQYYFLDAALDWAVVGKKINKGRGRRGME